MQFRVNFTRQVVIHYDKYTYSGLLCVTFEDSIRSCAANIAFWTHRTTDQVLQDMLNCPHKYRIQFDGYIEKVS